MNETTEDDDMNDDLNVDRAVELLKEIGGRRTGVEYEHTRAELDEVLRATIQPDVLAAYEAAVLRIGGHTAETAAEEIEALIERKTADKVAVRELLRIMGWAIPGRAATKGRRLEDVLFGGDLLRDAFPVPAPAPATSPKISVTYESSTSATPDSWVKWIRTARR